MDRVLFVCTHNTGRSVMAEAYFRQLAGDRYEVESAGMQPGELNPLVVEAMAEEGLDVSHKKPQSVFDLFKSGRLFSHVITVCDSSRESDCPVFPGITKRLHIPFDDPAKLQGSHEQKLAGTREIREQIKQVVTKLAAELD